MYWAHLLFYYLLQWRLICKARLIGGSCKNQLSGCIWLFASTFWEMAGTYEWHFVIQWMQVEWWGHSNPTCRNQICLNFLHSEVVVILKHLPHAHSCPLAADHAPRATLWNFHNIRIRCQNILIAAVCLTCQIQITLDILLYLLHLFNLGNFMDRYRSVLLTKYTHWLVDIDQVIG